MTKSIKKEIVKKMVANPKSKMEEKVPIAPKTAKRREYTGHYQMDMAGHVRHQSPKQVEKKGLNKY